MSKINIKKYKAAVVGCGRIGSLFTKDVKRKGIVTHAQAYAGDRRFELIAACDSDLARLKAFGRKWKISNLYTDVDQMIRQERIDALSICTPTESHEALTLKAIRGGVGGIICEKPIAFTLGEANQMIQVAREKNVPLIINHQRRYLSFYRAIQKKISKGWLGKIQSVHCFYGAGVLNTGTHLFDLLRFLVGDVDWVWADPTPASSSSDPAYSGYLHFKDGFGCALTALDVKKYLKFEVHIYGTGRMIRIDGIGKKMEVFKSIPSAHCSGYRELSKEKVLEAKADNMFTNILSDLVSALEGQGQVACSGADGRASLEIALALKQSANEGGKIYLCGERPILNNHQVPRVLFT